MAELHKHGARRISYAAFLGFTIMVITVASQSERPTPAEKYIGMVFDLGIPEGAKISTEEGKTTALPASLASPSVRTLLINGF